MPRFVSKPESAHFYAAEMGWKIFPLHNVTNGVCSCSAGASCDNKGKHPRTPHGLKDASSEAKQVDEWWSRWPDANIGVLTGIVNGFFILDVDGEEGQKSVAEYERGSSPRDLPVVRTGSGVGFQFYFKPYRDDIKNSVKKIAPGLDIRGEGGYGILPPSDHKSGNTYLWETSPEAPISTPPAWLRELVDHTEIGRFISESNGEVPEEIPEGGRNDALFKFGCLLRRRGFNREEIAGMLHIYNQRCSPPLEDTELDRIAESAERYTVEDPIEPTSPEDFFTRKKNGDLGEFVPKRLGDHISAQLRFASTEPKAPILFYNEKTGAWLRTGEQVIRSLSCRCLGEFTRRSRVEETLAYIQDTHYVDRELFDKDTTRMPFLNGNLNLLTGELEPHSPELYSLTYIPHNYVKDTQCPAWLKFLDSVVLKEDVNFLQEWFGYHLLREYKYQYALMLIGDGSNGKSTLINALRYAIGENNCRSYTLTDILTNRFASAGLYGKLGNQAADISTDEIRKSAKFKAMVGGDPIPAEEKFRPGFDFQNYAKLTFSANTLPPTEDNTGAFFRRWVILNFPNVFSDENRDVNMAPKLRAEAEGILVWAFKGLKRLLENGRFSGCKSSGDVQAQWDELSNPFEAWASYCTEEKANNELRKDTIYGAYVTFCKRRKATYTQDVPFWKKMKAAYYGLGETRPTKPDKTRPPCKTGLALKCGNCSKKATEEDSFCCGFDLEKAENPEPRQGRQGSQGENYRNGFGSNLCNYGEKQSDRKHPDNPDDSDRNDGGASA